MTLKAQDCLSIIPRLTDPGVSSWETTTSISDRCMTTGCLCVGYLPIERNLCTCRIAMPPIHSIRNVFLQTVSAMSNPRKSTLRTFHRYVTTHDSSGKAVFSNEFSSAAPVREILDGVANSRSCTPAIAFLST